jgi:hypothetical protein
MTKKNTSAIVPSVNKKTTELSKIQKQFNNKSKKVESLKQDIELIEAAIPVLKQRIHAELVPLREAIAEAHAEAIVMLDAAMSHKSITKTERQKIQDFIVEHTYVLIDRYKHEHLIDIFNRYSEDTYAEIQAEGAMQGKKMMSEMFEQFGMKVNLDDIDFTNIDEALEKVTEKFAEDIEGTKERLKQEAETAEERNAKRKKNAKEIAQEKIQQQQNEAMNKTLKELYTQLVKEFHPDKEQDITQKAWKTEVMKKITAAYEAKDFFALLKLQLEYEQRDAKSFEELPDEKLKHFIKILDEQIEDLKMQVEALMNPPMMSRDLEDLGEFLEQPKKIDANFKSRKQELQFMVKDAQQQVKDFKDIKAIKQFIKHYDNEPDMDFDLEELMAMLTRK